MIQRPETGKEMAIRIEKEEEMEALRREARLREFERLKKEFGA